MKNGTKIRESLSTVVSAAYSLCSFENLYVGMLEDAKQTTVGYEIILEAGGGSNVYPFRQHKWNGQCNRLKFSQRNGFCDDAEGVLKAAKRHG